jgi:hypothetical protein
MPQHHPKFTVSLARVGDDFDVVQAFLPIYVVFSVTPSSQKGGGWGATRGSKYDLRTAFAQIFINTIELPIRADNDYLRLRRPLKFQSESHP